jgi:hypothetical protein
MELAVSPVERNAGGHFSIQFSGPGEGLYGHGPKKRPVFPSQFSKGKQTFMETATI